MLMSKFREDKVLLGQQSTSAERRHRSSKNFKRGRKAKKGGRRAATYKEKVVSNFRH